MSGVLHVELDNKILARIEATATKIGWTKRELITRLLAKALPEWEKVATPRPPTKPTK